MKSLEEQITALEMNQLAELALLKFRSEAQQMESAESYREYVLHEPPDDDDAEHYGHIVNCIVALANYIGVDPKLEL